MGLKERSGHNPEERFISIDRVLTSRGFIVLILSRVAVILNYNHLILETLTHLIVTSEICPSSIVPCCLFFFFLPGP